jgi:hypothetical protein
MTNSVKKYPTIGACGLDCGLCPRYYTQGPSRCPGCCGPDFFSKHPSCSFITCCVKKKNFEVCADCNEFPCPKFEFEGENSYDSFITHRKTVFNLNFIKENGIERFIEQQKKRIKLLEIMIKNFDDGRSKSFYCIASALLSIESLEKSLNNVEKSEDVKIRAKNLKKILDEMASKEGVELKLRKK